MEKEIEIIYENTEQNIDVINDALEIGIIPQGTLNITENGEYDVTNYETANVVTPGIVPTGTLDIIENGIYNVTEYASADVTVPIPEPPLQTKSLTITENTTTEITPDTNYVGLSSVEIVTNIDINDLSEYFTTERNTNTSMNDRINPKVKKYPDIVIGNNVTDLSYCLYYYDYAELPRLVFNSNVVNISNGYRSNRVRLADMSGWDISNITNFSWCFGSANYVTSIITPTTTCNVETTLDYMFYGDGQLSLGDLSGFKVNYARNLSHMFEYCYNLTFVDIRDICFSPTYKNISVDNMFGSDNKLSHIDIRGLDFVTASVSNWGSMLNSVPTSCEIVVKDADNKTWFNTNFSTYTNVKTVAEYEGE